MEIFMKASGSMIKHMVMGHTNMLMVQLTLANGLKISNMEKELKNGQMEQNMKGTIKMVKSMEMAVWHSLMEVLILVSLRIMKYQGWVNMFGQMEKCMKDIGKRTKCTDKVY
jgi:hypothetical protein